jgi:hypothetical protein
MRPHCGWAESHHEGMCLLQAPYLPERLGLQQKTLGGVAPAGARLPRLVAAMLVVALVMLQAVLMAALISGARLPRLVLAMLVEALAMPTSLLHVR